MESRRGRTAGAMASGISDVVVVVVVVIVDLEFEDAGRATGIAGSHQAAAEDERR